MPIDAADLTDTHMGDLFKRPGTAAFMYDRDGNLLSSGLRVVPCEKIMDAMLDDVESERSVWDTEYKVASIYEVGVLSWQ